MSVLSSVSYCCGELGEWLYNQLYLPPPAGGMLTKAEMSCLGDKIAGHTTDRSQEYWTKDKTLPG